MNESEIFKRALFSKLKVDITPGNPISYLDGCLKHPGQQDIHFSDWRYFVAMWGRRTGKTIAAAAEVTAELAKPASRTWIVAPTYELTDRVFEYVFRWVVLDKCFGNDAVVKASKTKDLRYIETKWGSFVRGKSAEAPNSLIGDQLDLIVMDEAARIPELIFTENLEPTTLDRRGRVLFISTPRGKNWFFDYFERKDYSDTKGKGWSGSRFKSGDNPFLDKTWLESKRNETPEDVFRREYEASPEHFSGLIFPMFRDKSVENGGHVFDPDKIKVPSGTIYRAIDVGWRHPTYCVWAVVDRENNVWCFREYLGQPSVIHAEHAKNIAALSGGMKVYDTWISPDAKRKHPVVTRPEDTVSAFDIYQENGIFCRPAVDDWEAGVSVTGAYLHSTLNPNAAHPKVYISQELEALRKGLLNYVFQEKRGSSESNAPERPRKYRDDAVDGFRYLLSPKPRFAPEWAEADGDEFGPSRYGYKRNVSGFAPRRSGRSASNGPRIMGL